MVAQAQSDYSSRIPVPIGESGMFVVTIIMLPR
jgi:hypothetical protein